MGKIKAVIEMVTGETRIELVPDWMEYIYFVEVDPVRPIHFFDPLLPVNIIMTRRRYKKVSRIDSETFLFRPEFQDGECFPE